MGGGELDCNRKFVSNLMDRKDPAIFRSVRNIFLFGRGGTRNLKCVYKFEGMRGERVRIKLRKVTTLNRHCMSRVDEDINRSFCYGDISVKVEVSVTREQNKCQVILNYFVVVSIVFHLLSLNSFSCFSFFQIDFRTSIS